jgi:hypothetical protein
MSYILKVLKNEMKMIPQANKYYISFNGSNPMDKKKGTPFLFIRENTQTIENQTISIYEESEPF